MTSQPPKELYKKRDYSKFHYIVIQVKGREEEDRGGEERISQEQGIMDVAASEMEDKRQVICQHIARSTFGGFLLDSEDFGGVLQDHCVLAVEKHSTNPQIPSHVLERRALAYSGEGNDDDGDLPSHSSIIAGHSVVWAEEQIPYTHLYKRGPLPTEIGESEFIQKVRKALNLTDPGFIHQWHLVCAFLSLDC
jgi:hypothetical protein